MSLDALPVKAEKCAHQWAPDESRAGLPAWTKAIKCELCGRTATVDTSIALSVSKEDPMNGRDVADAQIDAHRHREQVALLLDWTVVSLKKKRETEPLTPFERELLQRAEKIQEM